MKPKNYFYKSASGLKVQRKKPKENTIKYTHRDSSGMGWRFSGSRPVSSLADKVMGECGLPPLK